jgi:hypothetical protein
MEEIVIMEEEVQVVVMEEVIMAAITEEMVGITVEITAQSWDWTTKLQFGSS